MYVLIRKAANLYRSWAAGPRHSGLGTGRISDVETLPIGFKVCIQRSQLGDCSEPERAVSENARV